LNLVLKRLLERGALNSRPAKPGKARGSAVLGPLVAPALVAPGYHPPLREILNDLRVRRNKIPDVPPPRFERGAPFLEILKPVVDGCNAADRAAHVVEHLVDNVRRNVQSRHAGGSRATKVVQYPMGNRGRLVAQLVPFGLEHRGIKALL